MEEELQIQTFPLRCGCGKVTVVFLSPNEPGFCQFQFVRDLLLWPFQHHPRQYKCLKSVAFQSIFRRHFRSFVILTDFLFLQIYCHHSFKNSKDFGKNCKKTSWSERIPLAGLYGLLIILLSDGLQSCQPPFRYYHSVVRVPTFLSREIPWFPKIFPRFFS